MLSVRPKLHTDNSSGDFSLPDLMHNKGFEDPFLIPTPSSGGKKHGKKKDKTRKGKGRRKDKKHKAVMVPPSQPNVTRLTDESVMLRWEVPENDGLKIQFFKVQYKDMGSGKGWNTIDDDIPPHIRSYEVRNLIINHIYRFRIAAVYTNNDNLLGRNSVRFHMQEPTTKKPPYPPTLTLTEAVSPSAIRIEWEIKSFNNAGASDSSSVFTTRTLDSEVTAPKGEDGVSDSGENTTTPPTYSNNDQLYMVLGTVLGGGLVLLLLLFLALYNCRQRQNALQGAHDIHDIYQTSTRDVGFNGNGIGNGHTQNGYLPQGKLNITNNPLSETDEDKNKNVMESSFMHRKNHSCPIAPAPEHVGHSRIQRGGNEVESEESTPSSSLDVAVVLCHQISDASSSCVESPSSPSWLKQKSVMGREDYV
ncbi:hypothetical protein J437_LFUL018991 [Ladona fulva]|uniref:Fibronectin type-III domain-containing protein n=1 Tax=Ladona fulva TaxID=123851 RepID=A0A8K0KPR2_LADFU|nr:hypothetical protein J437_LFUL018991 [Ladona fulva]